MRREDFTSASPSSFGKIGMSLLSFFLGPIRSLFAGSLRTVFEADVRNNPTIVNPIRQSDDDDSFQKEKQFGFAPQYVVSFRRPRTDLEAQRLYNHIRTISWYLDAIPLLGRKLPFNVGVESIIGLIPGVGDYIGFVLSLYAVLLSALFGLPLRILAIMMINIIVDAFIGLIPIVGDALDVAFKANLRNLRLMEDHLISTNGHCHSGQFQLTFPPSNVFLPKDSPQREEPMPQVSTWSTGTNQRKTWNATISKASSSSSSTRSRFGVGGVGQQGFHKGTMEEVMNGRQQEREMSSSLTAIVPKEVFTTMRYEAQGIDLERMCSAIPLLSQQLQNKVKKEKFPLLDRHIARLKYSVEAMKRQFPLQWGQCQPLRESKVRKKIENAVNDNHKNGSTRRIRVSVNQQGSIEVTTYAMSQNNSNLIQTVRFDVDNEQRVEEYTPSILFRYKTSHRQMYDNARLRVNATLGMQSGFLDDTVTPCFDVIMLHSDFITESSIANIIIHSHQSDQLFTPSAANLPLLPGLMRQELISRSLITELDINKDKLRSDLVNKRSSLYLCNALRGIIAVTLVD